MNDSQNRPLLYDHFKRSADALWAQYQKSKSQRSPANIGPNREDILGKDFLRLQGINKVVRWPGATKEQLDGLVRRKMTRGSVKGRD
jgi:hypothetical protein